MGRRRKLRREQPLGLGPGLREGGIGDGIAELGRIGRVGVELAGERVAGRPVPPFRVADPVGPHAHSHCLRPPVRLAVEVGGPGMLREGGRLHRGGRAADHRQETRALGTRGRR